MNVEIWTEAAQFPEKKYINGIFSCSVYATVSILVFATRPADLMCLETLIKIR